MKNVGIMYTSTTRTNVLVVRMCALMCLHMYLHTVPHIYSFPHSMIAITCCSVGTKFAISVIPKSPKGSTLGHVLLRDCSKMEIEVRGFSPLWSCVISSTVTIAVSLDAYVLHFLGNCPYCRWCCAFWNPRKPACIVCIRNS